MIPYDPYDPATKLDPHHYFDALREGCPVHHHVLDRAELDKLDANPWVAQPTAEFWSVFRYADCDDILQSPGLFSSKEGPGPERLRALSEDGMLVFADEPAHRRQRSIANKVFTPRMVAERVPEIEKVADGLIDELYPRGEAELITEFAAPMAIRVIGKIIGVGDSRLDDILRWGNDLVGVFGGDDEAKQRAMVSGLEFHEHLFSLLTPRKEALAAGEPIPDDVLGALLTAEHEGSRLTDEEVFMGCQQFVMAGFESTTSTIGAAIHLLCTNPDQRRHLTEDPSLIDMVVEETVRLYPPFEGFFRTATEDTRILDVDIPQRAKVRVVLAAANRDPRQFDRPHEFDLHRDRAELRKHLGFGHGIHACIGAALARAEVRIAVSHLLARLPELRLDDRRPAQLHTMLTAGGFKSVPVRWTP